METLTHLRASVCDKHRPIVVDVNKCSGLVEEYCCERNTKLSRYQSKSFFLPLMLCVEFVDSIPTYFIVRLLDDLLVHQWNMPILQRLVEMGLLLWFIKVEG